MPYTIGGKNIRDLAELGSTNDPREATGFTTSKYLYSGYSHQDWYGTRMFINYSGYIYSSESGVGTYFLRNGSTYFSVSAKGCRPCPYQSRKRWESSTANTYYVNRFSDGEVWVSTSTNSRTGTRISTTSDNIQYLFTMLIGPGGGGGGSSGTVSGGGGGGGAFAFLCHKLVADWIYRIYIGAGGSGGSGNSNGTGSGNCQAALFRSSDWSTSGVTMLNCMGGGAGQSGGNGGGGGSGGSVSTYDNNSSYLQRLDERSGTNGGSKGNTGGSTSAYETQIYSAEGHRLSYGQGGGGAGNYGGGGGSGWYYGHNGGKGGESYDPGSAGGIGAGGGGGAWVLFSSRDGGKGGNGYAALFY